MSDQEGDHGDGINHWAEELPSSNFVYPSSWAEINPPRYSSMMLLCAQFSTPCILQHDGCLNNVNILAAARMPRPMYGVECNLNE